MKGRTLTTLRILLGIAKFYKRRQCLTQKQEHIVNFNVCGGLPNFKNLVNECDLIIELEKVIKDESTYYDL